MLYGGSVDAGLVRAQTRAGAVVTATWRPPACLIVLSNGGIAAYDVSCGGGVYSLNSGPLAAGRLRRLPTEAAYAYVWTSAGSTLKIQRVDPTGGTSAVDWATITSGLVWQTQQPLGTLGMPSGAEFLAFGAELSGTPSLYVFLDGGTARTFNGFPILDVALFDNAGTPAAMAARLAFSRFV